MTGAIHHRGSIVLQPPSHSSGELRFDELMARASGLRKVVLWLLAAGAVGSTLWTILFVTDFATDFIAIIVPASLAVWIWQRRSHNEIPVFPMLIVQQTIVLAVPIVRRSTTLAKFSPELTSSSAWIFALFCGASTLGWLVGKTGRLGSPSRFGLSVSSGPNSNARVFSIGAALMMMAIAMRTATYLFPQYFYAGWFAPIYPIYRSFETAAELGGSFIAGLFLGLGRSGRAKSTVYWFLVLALASLSAASLLLSSAMTVLFSAVVGTAAGRGRVPWVLVATTFLVASVLHMGKLDMRNRHHDPKTNEDRRTLSMRTMGLPLFYWEWFETSLHNILAEKQFSDEKDSEDHGLMSRLDNLQNMNAVLDSLQSGVPVFGGRSYTMIPMLMIPRFLWTEKPRTHDAQVQFNLHFGRQKDEKETYQTYIAIGLLPEAVGNFGAFFGPVAIGIVVGWLAGCLERVALRKQVVSLEGMIVFSLTSNLALSFEMTAAVLLTATLQIVFGVVGGYILLGLTGFTVKYSSAPSY